MVAIRWCVEQMLPVTCVVIACLGLIGQVFVMEAVTEMEEERLANFRRVCDQFNEAPAGTPVPKAFGLSEW